MLKTESYGNYKWFIINVKYLERAMQNQLVNYLAFVAFVSVLIQNSLLNVKATAIFVIVYYHKFVDYANFREAIKRLFV